MTQHWFVIGLGRRLRLLWLSLLETGQNYQNATETRVAMEEYQRWQVAGPDSRPRGRAGPGRRHLGRKCQ